MTHIVEKLLEKANSLPLCPGVYLMKDRKGKVIYVGKSRKLKNRVSQYFQKTRKNVKTTKMVSSVEDFDYIVCKTEIEALTLENTLIKQYSPRYNIKLKDTKSYPYIKITDGEFPKIIYTRSRFSDKGKYFGPFSGTSTVFSVLDIIHKYLGIPTCKKEFPKDIGKERPCLYYQLGQCCGVCTGKVSAEEYNSLIKCAADILRGNISDATQMLNAQMLRFAENEQFEAAAKCRDTVEALKKLRQKQNVVASPDTEMDIFGLWTDDYNSCIYCMYVRQGMVVDTNEYLFSADADIDDNAICTFLVEHYIRREYIPKEIIISVDIDNEDKKILETYLSKQAKKKIIVRKPERGSIKQLCDTVIKNAQQKATQSMLEAQRDEDVLLSLAELLKLESIPVRIEAYDISNIGSNNVTAGMVVYVNGKPYKSDYRIFNIKSVEGIDDYASMCEALKRRIKRLKEDNSGAFSEYPDLLLIDGGRGHVTVVKDVLREYNIEIPVFGMVKDDYHKTRTLCTETYEINIAKDRAIFSLIYKIQEEVHRFTVKKMFNAKRATIKHSSLEKIDGIGPAKSKILLKHFVTLSALKQATIEELMVIKGINRQDAMNIYKYFNGDKAYDANNNG